MANIAMHRLRHANRIKAKFRANRDFDDNFEVITHLHQIMLPAPFDDPGQILL